MTVIRLVLALLLVSEVTLSTRAQEFKPYPKANITEAQWRSYFDEVQKKHGSTVQDLQDQRLLVYTDMGTGTVYGFTKPGHRAHPAWIARKPEQRTDAVFIGQIGYFAGAEPPFAELFREYLALNDKMKEDIQRRQQQSEKQAPGSSASVEPASDRPQQKIASSNPDPSWRPSAAQEELVATVSRSYFAARDGGKAEEAYAFLSPKQRENLPYGDFQKLLAEANAVAGAVQSRRLRAVTWYRDTPQAGPGLYAAVDFTSSFDNLALHCGHVVWQEQANGSFLQVREEVSIVDNATMRKLKPADLEKARAQFRC